MALLDELCTMIDGRAGKWGLYARHLNSGETIAIRADDLMPAQSSVKVCVLLSYTKMIGLGKDDPDRRVSVLAEDHELGSGVLRYLAPGYAQSVLPTRSSRRGATVRYGTQGLVQVYLIVAP